MEIYDNNFDYALVVVTGAFIKILLHNHSVIYKILIFFFRRSKRQRIFSLFYFASPVILIDESGRNTKI